LLQLLAHRVLVGVAQLPVARRAAGPGREQLEQGTEKTYDVFAQCVECGRVYWRGAHHARLEAIVSDAVREFGGAAAR
uniref:Mut7-C RNAse domain-containing protein n=1 Tax=Streptomyces sp. NRRL B-24572 TaxID=1962156 RepID=UPI00211B5A03